MNERERMAFCHLQDYPRGSPHWQTAISDLREAIVDAQSDARILVGLIEECYQKGLLQAGNLSESDINRLSRSWLAVCDMRQKARNYEPAIAGIPRVLPSQSKETDEQSEPEFPGLMDMEEKNTQLNQE